MIIIFVMSFLMGALFDNHAILYVLLNGHFMSLLHLKNYKFLDIGLFFHFYLYLILTHLVMCLCYV